MLGYSSSLPESDIRIWVSLPLSPFSVLGKHPAECSKVTGCPRDALSNPLAAPPTTEQTRMQKTFQQGAGDPVNGRSTATLARAAAAFHVVFKHATIESAFA